MSVLTSVSWEALRGVVVVGSVLVSTLALVVLGRDDSAFAEVRSRLVHGVPWGTLLTALFVLSVYLFLQGGLAHPRRPLALPFHSWSYFYPLGMVTAPFSHAGRGHLIGNLLATVAYASVAEYAWGHYPRGRGVGAFTSRWTNPYVRILAVPAASVVVGLFSSLFALGPVIGFSGVVFGYAGFALVQRPVLGALAILGYRMLDLVIGAVMNPVSVTSPRPRVVTPWWADVAIQGHAIGILAGVLVGVGLSWSRDEWPDPRRVWFGLLAFATVQGLWAVYVPGNAGRFVLFRWAGVALVFVLATVIVVAASRSTENSLPGLGVSDRTVAVAFVVLLLGSLSGAAVFYNVAPIGQQEGPEPSVEVRGYSVGYAENVENRYVGAVEIPFVDLPPRINTSGVVVTNERRQIWLTEVGAARLENRGRASVLVGGLGWRERVFVNRTGWSLAGGGSVYQVYLRPAGENRTLGYASEPARAAPVVAGRNVSMRSVDGEFRFVVSQGNETVGTAPVPANGSAVDAGGLTFSRDGSEVVAVQNETRVPIASRNGNG